ncbi:MAG: general secretion pathway protein GspF [Candidatus Parcubacteria bacterium]|nr:MAG: general secretion pathway protein GspF [Candidatus Parcubacteria bacterium]
MKFEFRGFDQDGNFKTGILEAQSQEQAVLLLQNQGIVVTYISKPSISKIQLFFNKISLLDLAFFCKSLNFLLKSKTEIDESIKSLSYQVNKQFFKNILEDIYQQIISGISLSEALNKYPNVFPNSMVKLIKIGELSGNLEEVFKNLSEYFEEQHKLFSKVIQSLYYPAIVILIFITTIIFLFFNVIPQISNIFIENNIELPKITKNLLSVSTFVVNYWYYILIGIIIFIYSLIEFLKTDDGKLFLYNMFVNFPIIGSLLKEIYIVSFIQSLIFLIKGGITISESLEIVSQSINNPYYKNAIKYLSDETQKGKQISESIKIFPDLFPPFVVQGFITGEKTGELTNSLTSILEYYKIDINNKVNNLGETIQPIIIIVLAIGLIFIEASLIIPISELTKSISQLR